MLFLKSFLATRIVPVSAVFLLKSIFEDTYFILQNKDLCIYEDIFGAKILRDDCALNILPSIYRLPGSSNLIHSNFI